MALKLGQMVNFKAGSGAERSGKITGIFKAGRGRSVDISEGNVKGVPSMHTVAASAIRGQNPKKR